MKIEYGIQHRDGDLHRGPMTKDEAEQWIAEMVKMGMSSDSDHFKIVSRIVGDWVSAGTDAGNPIVAALEEAAKHE